MVVVNDQKAKEIKVFSGSEYEQYEIWFNEYKIKITHTQLKELMEEITSAQYKNVIDFDTLNEIEK